MALLIDTSVLVAIERVEGSPSMLLAEMGEVEVAISAITASELLHGVHRAEGAWRRGRREQFVERVLEALPVLPVDLQVARVHARIWADLKKRGQIIGAHDLIIAATALANQLRLVTRDPRDFGRVEGLEFSTW